MPLLTIDERLDVLLHVKWTVKEFDCNLTRDVRTDLLPLRIRVLVPLQLPAGMHPAT